MNIKPQITQEQLQEVIAKLEADNAALRANQSKPKALTPKVSEKGGVSVYGLGRFPVTLYREQWERLLNFAPSIIDFINEHAAELSVKPEVKSAA